MHRRRIDGKYLLALTIAAFFLIGLLLYGRTLTHDFVALDDDIVIFHNPIVQEMTPRTIAQAFTTYDPELYVPLTVISLQISQLMGGGEPWAFHLGNVLLHIGNALLVAWLLALLLKHRWIGIGAGLIWLTHPLNTEAVAWASARKDVLSAFFGLGSCIAYVYGIRGWKFGRRVSLELFVCALLAKVSVIVLPVWFVLFDWIEHRTLTKTLLRRQWPFFGLAAVFGAIAIAGKPLGVSGLPLHASLALGAKAAVQYITQFFVPLGLSITYEFTGPLTTLRPDLLLSSAACIVLIAGAWAVRRRLPLFSAGIGIYVVTLLPSCFNVLKGRTIYYASDRYAYLALIGLLLALAAVVRATLQRYPGAARPLAVVIAAAAASWTVAASHMTGLWRDTVTLFEYVQSVSSDSAMLLNNLGNAYIASGRPQEAETLYRSALERHPDWGTLQMNLANALEAQGKTDEAILLLHNVIETSTEDRAEAWYRLGNVYAAQGRKEDAVAAYQESMMIDPRFVMERFGETEELVKP